MVGFDVMELAIKVILSYLLGSIMGSLLVGRLRGGVDIRSLGSGNAGSTNALRTQGKGFAFWVLLIDLGKGWLATPGGRAVRFSPRVTWAVALTVPRRSCATGSGRLAESR